MPDQGPDKATAAMCQYVVAAPRVFGDAKLHKSSSVEGASKNTMMHVAPEGDKSLESHKGGRKTIKRITSVFTFHSSLRFN